jgi:hypothetical protein
MLEDPTVDPRDIAKWLSAAQTERDTAEMILAATPPITNRTAKDFPQPDRGAPGPSPGVRERERRRHPAAPAGARCRARVRPGQPGDHRIRRSWVLCYRECRRTESRRLLPVIGDFSARVPHLRLPIGSSESTLSRGEVTVPEGAAPPSLDGQCVLMPFARAGLGVALSE